MIEAMSKFQTPAKIAGSPSSPISGPEMLRSLLPSSKFILMIDNSPTIQKIVEITLRREGYDIGLFRNGIDAMRWFSGAEARTPDLMLVDLGLPKLNGYDVVQKFKAKSRFAQTSCVILAGQSGTVDEDRRRMVGATAYLTKPFTTQELLTTVRKSLPQAQQSFSTMTYL